MGCSSSRDIEVYSRKAPRPQQQQYSSPGDNAHLVALTSSTYGFLRLDSQKKSEDPNDAAEDPVNQMYQKMMNLDAPGAQLPQSWTEVSNALSQLKNQAQQQKTSRPSAVIRSEPQTVDVSELLENSADEDIVATTKKKKKKEAIAEADPQKPKAAAQRRGSSVIHTLEEVDKLAIVAVSPEAATDSDEFPEYSFKSTRTFDKNTRPDQRFSLNSAVVRRPINENKSTLNKPSKSLSYDSQQESTLFDADFLESFKEAFEQISNGMPSAVTSRRKPTARGNKISQQSRGDDQKSVTVGSSKQIGSIKNKLQLVEESQQQQPRNTLMQNGDHELNTFSLHTKLANLKKLQDDQNSVQGKVANWQKKQDAPSSRQKEIPVFSTKNPPDPLLQYEKKCPPEGENRVVLYSTSLRGIRKTFEDCNSVRSIVQSFNVEVDERDVSMDAQFRQELKDLMDKPVPVPRLFIKGRYIGGVDEVVQVHENGGLAKLLEGIPSGNFTKECDGCGGVRFIPCTDCSGSCKAVGSDGSVIKCAECNENGLVRCPICS